jgi:hypothetical protein
VRLRKTIPVRNQPDHHLLAVRPLVAQIFRLSLPIPVGLPFEAGRRSSP